MNTKWVGIVLLGLVVSSLSFSARTYSPSYLESGIVGVDGYSLWALGASGSTWQDWTFTTMPALLQVPDTYHNPYDQGDALKSGPFTSVFYDSWNNAGYCEGELLSVLMQIPNSVSTEKNVWFEVVYQGAVQYDWDNVGVRLYTDLDANGEPIADGVDQVYFSNINQIDPAGQATGWKVMTIGWTIKPSPSKEWFSFYVFGPDAKLSSISVDTLSNVVPTPGAIVLTSLGALIVGYFRKKY